MSSLGEAITTARRALGLTQEELAAASGVTQAALSRYENGMREPDADVLVRLAAALGVTEPFLKGRAPSTVRWLWTHTCGSAPPRRRRPGDSLKLD